jgi:porphobilinogen synthase
MTELPMPSFPHLRMRRNRRTSWSRDLVRENSLQVSDLIWPVFVIEGKDTAVPVPSMPGVERHTVDRLVRKAEQAAEIGIPAIALFPNTPSSLRSADAREAFNPDNLVCQAVRAIKDAVPDIGIMCDVALDPYTSHGHDGLMDGGEILNDATIEALVKQSLVQAQAGCDIIAPSDMMDGRTRGQPAAACPDHGLQRQVCIRILWTLPRCRGVFRHAGR